MNDDETSAYTKAAAIVAAAIVLLGGGVAATIVALRSPGNAHDDEHARQAARRATRLHREVTHTVRKVRPGAKSSRTLARLRREERTAVNVSAQVGELSAESDARE